MIRTLTEHDDLALERTGYERGTVLQASTGRSDAHQYRVDPTYPLVVDGLVLLDEDAGTYRFLDTTSSPLTVRDLRRFRILVKLSEGRPTGAAATGVPSQPESTDLVDLRDDALDNDLIDGVDFAIGTTSAEEAITFDEGFVVGYRDEGTTTTLFASRSYAQARAVFLDEACWLGAERGRGTYVGRSQAVGTEDWTPAQVVAAYERRLLGES
jgi:hypothetical protein